MFNWNEFDKLFNEMLSSSINEKNWNKRSYVSPDGSFSMSYMTRNFDKPNRIDEVGVLKEKLNLSIKEENFESAVELRDQIKKLEQNREEISKLQSKINDCVKNQDFETAIKYRDKIRTLK